MEQSKTYRAKISSQGQVTIPVVVRKLLALEKGQFVTFFVSDGALGLVKTLPIEKYFGKVTVLNGTDPEKYAREYRKTFLKNISND